MSRGGPLSVGEAISLAADRFGEAEFLRLPDARSFSFREYERLTRCAAAAWRAQGVAREDVVVVALRNGLEFLLAWHGLNRIGAVMVPLNLHFTAGEARYVLQHSRATKVLSFADHISDVILPALDGVATPPDVVTDLQFIEGIEGSEPATDDSDVTSSSAAAVLYTSGTTGPPKGCITTHEHYTINGRVLAESIGLRPGSTKLVMLPLFHMNAENSTMAVLAAGATALLRDGFSASRFWSLISEHAVTHTHYLGSVLPALDVQDDPELGPANSLEVLWGAGCSPKVHERLEARWGVRIIEVFGMTETGMDLCNPYDGPRRAGSCGTALPGRRIRLLDEGGGEVPVGAVGEIVIERAPGMTLGYLHDNDATERLFRDGWLHTGDLARRDEDGYFYFVDRAKDIIRRSGENIGSAEVEGVLRSHPSVEDVACIPFPDRVRGEEVHAVILLAEGSSPSEVAPQALVEWCGPHLAAFKIPRFIEYVEDLPRTPTGKIQKAQLRGGGEARVILDREDGWRPVEAVLRD